MNVDRKTFTPLNSERGKARLATIQKYAPPRRTRAEWLRILFGLWMLVCLTATLYFVVGVSRTLDKPAHVEISGPACIGFQPGTEL